ncbi:hypothetical protein Q5O24_05700 [Eubacteriaceae bacterium ES3]|nr:hypothetical protein Q5O24_05700 [Eubacteriaceae bacterium ES3]
MKCKNILPFMIFFVMAIFLTGCTDGDQNAQSTVNQTAESDSVNQYLNDDPIYQFYNLTELNQMKVELDERLGVVPQIDEAGMYNYIDNETGYGVFVSFDSGDAVVLKGLYIPEGGKALVNLSNASVNQEMVSQVTGGISFEEAVGILGSGAVEIVCSHNPADPDNPFYAMAWMNQDGSLALVYFEGYKGIVNSAEFLSSVE